jgi:hypothetical protein
MNGKRARTLRKQVYGPDGAPRHREYSRPTPYAPRTKDCKTMSDAALSRILWDLEHSGKGTITAGWARQAYQDAKKAATTQR